MNKIMIFAVSGNEEQVFSDIQEYLQLKTDCVNISTEQIMKLSFASLEVDFYCREVRIDKNVINFTDLEFRIFTYLASLAVYSHTSRSTKAYGEKNTSMKKESS